MNTPTNTNTREIVDEITLQYNPNPNVIRRQIQDPHTAADFLREIWNDCLHIKESFYVVLLDNSKNVTGYSMISMGGSTATIVDPAEVIRLAVRGKCCSILLAHNHPSGTAIESSADINITKRIAELGKLLGVPVDDHIILAGDSAMSFRAKGLL